MLVNLHRMALTLPNIYIELPKKTVFSIKQQIKRKYRSLVNYARAQSLNYNTLKVTLHRGRYFSPDYLFPILRNCGIDKEIIIGKILSFRLWGSHAGTVIPKTLNLDSNTAYNLGLYAAEGDTGFNGKTVPSKLRITNALSSIILSFRDQFILNKLNQTEGSLQYYIYFPLNALINYNRWEEILRTSRNRIHTYYDPHVTIPKIRLSCEKKILLLITLRLISLAKTIGKNNLLFGCAYVRGLFDGEGTAYCKRMKYIRIEMRNQVEMSFVYETLMKLGIITKLKERRTRRGMYTLMISRYHNISNFSKNIGFKLNQERSSIVTRILEYYANNPRFMH